MLSTAINLSNCINKSPEMFSKIQFCFNFICYLTTLSLFIFGIYKFIKNEDLCETSFKSFNEGPYPSITVCFTNPFNEGALNKMGLNKSIYLSYLTGNYFGDEMLNVDFNEATLNLKNVIVEAGVNQISKENNEDQGHYRYAKITNITQTSMIWITDVIKCVTLDMPLNQIDIKMVYASLAINNSIFRNIPLDNLMLWFHYPQQLFRPVVAYKYKWPKRFNHSSPFFERTFILKSMEVLHRRNKALKPCKYYSDYDESFKTDMMQKAGCRPPYWTNDKNLPVCTSKEKMKVFASDIYLEGMFGQEDPKYIPNPCVDLQKLTYTYDENDMTLQQSKIYVPRLEISENDSIMVIMIDFMEKNFKEIKQVNAFGIESLIGNVGGYIGLFLGFSIIQLPNLCLDVKRWLYRRKMGATITHEDNMVLPKEDILSTIELSI